MTNPIANFSGLSSGVQWNDIIESTFAAEESRLVTPVKDQLEARTAQRDAWTSFQKLVDTLNEKSRALRASGFGGYLSTVQPSPTTGNALFGASASANAEPGRYKVEVLQLAETAKLGGKTIADRSAALNLNGDFIINGAVISVSDTDTLESIRDRINSANSGANATGVSASIINEGGSAGRLVLTRNTSGSAGIEIEDGTGGLARELGFLDSRTRPVSSTTSALAAALGIAVSPPPASIRVGDRVITVDLENDSISGIVAKINAAGGQASVEEIQFGDELRYQLVTDGNVQAVAGDSDSQAVIDALGFTAGKSGSVRQVVSSGALSDSAGTTATTSTLLSGLRLDGNDVGIADGDAINIRGIRGDGSVVNIGIAIDPGETVQDLLDKINDATSGFGAGDRTASAVLGEDGKIRLIDSDGGSSRLSFSMDIVRADGSTGSLGSSSIETAGRSRELQQGRDAIIRVDGTEFVRSSNNIADVIPEVALSLTSAEVGSEVDLVIERNVDGASSSIKEFTESYNAVRKFFDENRQVGAALYANSSFRSIIDTFGSALRTEVSGNETYTHGTIAGITLDRNGFLTFKEDTFKQALNSSPQEIGALFGAAGIGGAFVAATDQASAFGTGTISTQLHSIDEATARLRTREADAMRRLELRRQMLVSQFTQMETMLSRLNSQGTALAGLLGSLQKK